MWGIGMQTHRRQFLQMAASATTLAALSGTGWAFDYPTRPIHLIVGFPPGGAADLLSRLVGQALSERLGQQIVVENRAGASSNIATEFVVRAAPDGYTLLDVTSVNSWNAALFNNLKFDFIRDLVLVGGIYHSIGVLVVHPSFPANTLPEFIAYVKANPGKLRMASGGVGTPQHLGGELFKEMVGVDMLHVPYRGGGPALTDLLGGHVDVMFDTIITSIEHIRAGKLRPLGVTSAKRAPVLPNVPTIAEVVPGYEASGYQGIGAPVGTPAAIVDRLNNELNRCLTDPKLAARITDLGGEPFPSSPAEFRSFVVAFTERWGQVIRAAEIKAE